MTHFVGKFLRGHLGSAGTLKLEFPDFAMTTTSSVLGLLAL